VFHYKALLLATLLAGCFTGLSSAQVTLGADDLRQAASVALKSGESNRALAYADALLERDPADLTALLIRARALRDQGRLDPARTAARNAWSLADTDAEKYSAALITAQILSSDGKRTRAQLWLRRAVEHAPSARLEDKAKRDFAYVKRRNPWSTQLSFTLAPNSNINNGSARDRSLVFNPLFGQPTVSSLRGSLKSLSGIEIGGAVRTRYRFEQSSDTAHDLKFALSYRTYMLSSDAKTQAPDVEGSDFAYGTASLGYGYQQRNMDKKGLLAFDLDAGQTWYGGARYTAYLRGSAQQSVRVSAQRQYRFGLSAEREWGQAAPDVDSFSASASLTQRFESGNLGFFGVNVSATQSPNSNAEYAELSIRGGFVLGKPVMGAALQFGLGAALRDYDVSRHALDGRQDMRVFADITATFKDIDYYGFNPSVTVRASHTDSNIGLFDTRRLGVSIGIKSAF
jgi:tetratricopeptide (TPR) repeat protein